MNVLMSGVTSRHINSGRSRYDYAAAAAMIRDALIDAGVNVDHRRTVPGEDLTGYDCVLVGQWATNALGATYLFSALDLIARAKQSGCGLMFYVDDWQLHLLKTGVRAYAKDPKRMIRDGLDSCRRDWEWGLENIATMAHVMEALRDRPWPRTLVCTFDWGDHSMLTKYIDAREYVFYDPSAYVPDYPIASVDSGGRYGQWVLGTLSDQRQYLADLELKWPVRYLGGKKAKAETAVTEADLLNIYGQNWGVLSPPYKHAGSGWWRARFVLAARARSILYAAPAEVAGAGAPYAFDPKAVEELSIPQLTELANEQSEHFLTKLQWSKDQVRETLLDAVSESIKEART